MSDPVTHTCSFFCCPTGHTADPSQSAGSVKCLRYQPSPRPRKPLLGPLASANGRVTSMSCGASTMAHDESSKSISAKDGGPGAGGAIVPETRSLLTRGDATALVQQS